MNFFKNLVRKERIRDLAAYKSNIEYYKNIVETEEKTINYLQNLIDELPLFPIACVRIKVECIQSLYLHCEELDNALGEIEYRQTIYDDLYNKLYPEQK